MRDDIASVPRMVQNLVGALQVRGNADVSLRSRLTTHLTIPRCRFGVRAVPKEVAFEYLTKHERVDCEQRDPETTRAQEEAEAARMNERRA